MSVITFLHFCCVPSALLQHSRWLSETILPSASFSPSHCHSIIQGTTVHFLLISSSLFLHLPKYHCSPSLRLWELISNCCDSRSYVVFELSLNLQTLTWVKLLSQIFYACTLIFQLMLKCGCFDEALERFIISCVAVEEFDLWCSLELAQLDPTDSSQTRHRLLKMRPTRAMTLKESHALVSLMQVAVAQVGE